MIGAYLEIKALKYGFYKMSNGDILYEATSHRPGWYIEDKKSKYVSRYGSTAKEALALYEERSGNIIINPEVINTTK